MARLLGVDRKLVLGPALVVTGGIAVCSTGVAVYQWSQRRRHKTSTAVYETQKLLHEYLVFHYGAPTDVLSWDFGPKDALDFPKRCADLCVKYIDMQSGVPNRALDIGCAVGRSVFELARQFEEVVGIDYSQSFVDACNHLKDQGSLAYSVCSEGELTKDLVANVDPIIDRSRTSFQQGDACNLPLDLGSFGCVLAANLICRLHTPQDFLSRLSNLVAPNGIVIITSPYTFLPEYTPKENLIGGFLDKEGKPVSGFQGLKNSLEPSFELIAEENMPFFIRETARKNQWTVAHATVWKRRS